jgi:hypothetical protein
MPRIFSRLTLEVKEVGCALLQDISLREINAEGTPYSLVPEERPVGSRVEQFARLWDSINAQRGYGWNKNPFVWFISFEVVKI